MKTTRTARGFARIEFCDTYGVACSLQKSSCADTDQIWFGCNEANLRALIPGKGWTEVKLPTEWEWLSDTRMHLNRKQVASLLPRLIKFVLTGNL